MSRKQGYCITAWRLRLRCGHPEWLGKTQEFYNRLEKFYLDLYLAHPELWELNAQQSLRQLEVLTLPGREKRQPEAPLPWEKVPLYFRRAAANAAVSAAKSYLARRKTGYAGKPEALSSPATYYKGMYRGLTSGGADLKVWDGEKWRWMHCRLYGRGFPEDAAVLSPSVVLEGRFPMLHVPVKETVPDASTLEERLAEGRNVCGVQFTNGDAFAAASVLDADGREVSRRFFRGGKEYRHLCGEVLQKIGQSESAMGPGKPEGDAPKRNQKYWLRLKHLSDHYSNETSRGIVDFCRENGAAAIAVPKYGRDYSRHVMKGAGNWGSLHLSTKIREQLSYKAWKEGILVIEVNAEGTSSACAVCGKPVVRTDRKTQEYICEEGHRGNRYLNTARNLGKKCLAYRTGSKDSAGSTGSIRNIDRQAAEKDRL